jgi:ABC-2 type transport system ATP-binding protein
MTEADDLCHRVALLSEGRIVALDTPRALKLGLGSVPEVDVVLADGREERLAARRRAGLRRAGGAPQARRGARDAHSEPTLADVFIELAGRTLYDDEEAVR